MRKSIIDLENDLRNRMLSGRSIALLNAFGGEYSEENINLLTHDFDIDNGNYLYLLMLGILGFQNGWKYFPQDMIPRIQGIHRYEQVKNSSTVPWFANQISVLTKAGIPVMLTGNTAIRYAFLPDVTRFIRGFDLTVPTKDYDRAAELLRSEIKASDKSEFNNRTIAGMTEILLHKGVHDHRLFEEDSFWNTSKDMIFQANNVKAPSLENQLLLGLCVPYGHFLARENEYDRLYRLVTAVQMLRDAKIDPEKIASDARRRNVNCQVRFQMALLMPFAKTLKDADIESIAEDEKYSEYLSKLTDYLDHPSVQKEYQLMNGCFRPEDEQVSLSKYIADTRRIHSLTDLGKYVRKRTRSRRETREGNNGTK